MLAKADLAGGWAKADERAALAEAEAALFVSTETGDGLEDLKRAMLGTFAAAAAPGGGGRERGAASMGQAA